MTCVGEFGITTIAERDIVVNQQLHAFVCSDKIDAYFLSHALQMRKSYLETIAHFTTIPYLNKTKCNNVPIPLPPIHEQIEISTVLRASHSKIVAEQQRLDELQKLFKSMLHQLMTGQLRVTGELPK